METTEEKIKKAETQFDADPTLTLSLVKHLENENYEAYSQAFSAEAQKIGIILSPEEVSTHFGFHQSQKNPTLKEQVKETAKDEVKGAAKDEATGRAEDEIGNQLGVNLGGVGDATGEVGGFFKNLFGKKKK